MESTLKIILDRSTRLFAAIGIGGRRKESESQRPPKVQKLC
jgi:hypothetical protein